MNTTPSRSARGALIATLVALGVSLALAGTGATLLLTQDDTSSLDAPSVVDGPAPDPTAEPTADPTPPEATPEPTAVAVEPTPEPEGVDPVPR